MEPLSGVHGEVSNVLDVLVNQGARYEIIVGKQFPGKEKKRLFL